MSGIELTTGGYLSVIANEEDPSSGVAVSPSGNLYVKAREAFAKIDSIETAQSMIDLINRWIESEK